MNTVLCLRSFLLLRSLFLSFICLCLFGCAGNYPKVALSDIVSETPRDSYAHIVLADSNMAYMSAALADIEKVAGVKDLRVIRFDGERCISFWVPVRIGGDGRSTEALSIYRGESRRGMGVGLMVNDEWLRSFPRNYTKGLVLLELHNDTQNEFVSVLPSEYGADFNDRSSMFYKKRIARGEAVDTVLIMNFDPWSYDIIGHEHEKVDSIFEPFLLEVKPEI
ncbi:hypothetical protein [Pseudomonas citronellolis]|uniref:hypothetical protein n=1 Tax=Pseudomonas citronellolis TaxID=53408 RepID=UPI0023E45F98|nr:hypothetical protein [Pseudomonas citronellolis]MDF3931167.1 hypothetical protein [Pseudomonas citronellolis]